MKILHLSGYLLVVFHVSLCFGSYTKPCFTTGKMGPNERKDGDLNTHHFTLCTIKFPITGDVIVLSHCVFCSYRMVVSGPGMHFLHQLLENLSPRSTSVSVLKKVVVDRLVFTPPYLFIFFFSVALLEV